MVKCPECGKELKNTQGLNGHMRLKHGKRLLTKAGVLSAPIVRLEKHRASAPVTECPTEWFACGHTEQTFSEDCPLCQKRLAHAVEEVRRYVREQLSAGHRVVFPVNGKWYEALPKYTVRH